MSLESALVAHLKADSAITAICADRITPLVRDRDGTLPAATYQRLAGIPATDLDGLDGNLIEARMQIDCWARGYDEVRALAEAIRTRLQTAASTFHAVTHFDQDFYEDDTRIFQVSLDITIWYSVS